MMCVSITGVRVCMRLCRGSVSTAITESYTGTHVCLLCVYVCLLCVCVCLLCVCVCLLCVYVCLLCVCVCLLCVYVCLLCVYVCLLCVYVCLLPSLRATRGRHMPPHVLLLAAALMPGMA